MHLILNYIKGIIDSIFIFKHLFLILQFDVTRKLLFKIISLNFLFWQGIYKFLCFFSEYFIDINTQILIDILWFYPLYIIIYFLNIKYHSNIISSYFNHKVKNNISTNIKKYIVHKIWYHLTFICFIIMSSIISYTPFIGIIIYWFFNSLIYSFFCWEYYWDLMYVNHEDRFILFQNNWIYFLGYGTVFSLLKICLPLYISFLIISILYPILSIKCIDIDLPENDAYQLLSFFNLPFKITYHLLKILRLDL